MPPQTVTPGSQPNSQFDFIMKDQEESKKGPGLPSFGLPKPALYTLVASVVILVIIVVYAAVSGGHKSKSDQIVSTLGHGQEIIRASGLALPDLKDPNSENAAATTVATLTSQQSQLTTYLKNNGTKVDAKSLATYKNSSTDTQFTTANQSNNLDSVYSGYLKTQLAAYDNNLKAAEVGTGVNGLRILKASSQSVETILAGYHLQ